MFCKNGGGAGKFFYCNDDVSAVKSNPKTEICRFSSVEPCKKNCIILFLVSLFLTVLMFCKNYGDAGKCFHCNISAVAQPKSNLKPVICRFRSVEPCKKLHGFICSSST
jgi:hypothetical protein